MRGKDADEELIKLIRDLKLEYGYKLDQEFNRAKKGRNWWSNIKTNAGFRSSRPNFEHELTIDYDRIVNFNSDINSTLILIDHFTRQLESAPKLVGDEALHEMDKNKIDKIMQRLDNIKEDISDYEEVVRTVSEEEDQTSNT